MTSFAFWFSKTKKSIAFLLHIVIKSTYEDFSPNFFSHLQYLFLNLVIHLLVERFVKIKSHLQYLFHIFFHCVFLVYRDKVTDYVYT